MFIYPQHFQQQDTYFEKLLVEYHLASPGHGFGFIACHLDRDALNMNKILLTQCRGVLPDGTLFNAPAKDELPPAIAIPPEYNTGLVYVGTSMHRLVSSNQETQARKHLSSRYASFHSEFADLNQGQAEPKEIEVCRLNLNLFLETDDLAEISCMPVLKIRTSIDGVYLAPEVIPPALRVHGFPALEGYLNKVLGMLTRYANSNTHSFEHELEAKTGVKAETMLVSQTVAKYRYVFFLLSQDPYLTPYKLFEKIVELISSLSIFTTSAVLEEHKVSYDHGDLYASFEPLMEMADQIISSLNRKLAFRLDFQMGPGIHTVRIPDKVQMEGSDFTIGIAFNEGLPERQSLLKHVKVASSGEIRKIVSAQVSGVKLHEVSTLPSHVAYEDKTIYLQIAQEGSIWEQVVGNRDVGLYTSPELKGVKQIVLWIIAK